MLLELSEGEIVKDHKVEKPHHRPLGVLVPSRRTVSPATLWGLWVMLLLLQMELAGLTPCQVWQGGRCRAGGLILPLLTLGLAAGLMGQALAPV